MKSWITPNFRKLFSRLPEQVQRQARSAYRKFQRNPYHPSLQLKQVCHDPVLFSVRINEDYRAVGKKHAEGVAWFWIGSHAAYELLLRRR